MFDKESILVVDDDIEDHQILLAYFEDSGVSESMVTFAKNGKLALEYLAPLENGALPKLIVLDLNMPIMNGMQTLLRLKEDPRLKKIPVIIYSTSVNEEEKRKSLGFGALDYVMKPMSFNEGKNLVERFLSFVGK